MNLRLIRLTRLGGGETRAMIDGQLYRRMGKDGADVDYWLKANAVFGAIVVVGLVAMAVIGSSDSRDAQRAAAARHVAEAAVLQDGFRPPRLPR
jgi:hypothetical protein